MKKVFTKAQKMRIYPNEEQRLKIEATLGCCRYIYNHMLDRNNKVYKRRGEHLSYIDMQNLLTVMKGYTDWLREADSQALKYACRCVDNAYKRFFKKQGGYPNFKRKHSSRQSYTTTKSTAIHHERGRVKLPCLGWVKSSNNREIKGTICYATVSRDNDKYYVSITYKFEKDVTSVTPKKVVALDYKSDGLYVDSDGNTADMPKYFRQSEKTIAKEQRKLSKKQLHSNNWNKQKERVGKKHRKASNQRLDFLHKDSTRKANEYDAVIVEDLDMKSMSRGLKLGKSTLDNGWGMYTTFLKYKLEERGGCLLKIDKWFPSSQLCSECGYKNEAVKNLSVRRWTCPKCGETHDRDVNAAKNILAEGMKQL